MWNLTLINTEEWILFGQVHEIVDLTLLIDQIHPFTVFWFRYLFNKAVGFTTHLAMRKGWPSSLGLLPLLTHHNPYRSFALSILTRVHDSSYSKSMVFIDSDDLSQTSRPLIHEPVRSDDGMIYSITRIRCPQWFNAAHCDLFCSRLLPFGLIILVSPSSLLSSSAQDEEGNLIDFSIRYQRDLELSPAFPDADGVSSALSVTRRCMNTATHLAQLVGGSEYENSSTEYLTDLKEYK